MNASITIDIVNGGFVLTTSTIQDGETTEVFVSQGKLMKAVRTFVDTHSLIKKDVAEAAE